MPKLPTPPKTNYSLRRRFFDYFGRPMKWQDTGKGVFDLETVQRQIRTLAAGNKKVEIEFIYNGKLCGFDGNETGATIILEKR